MEDFFDILIYLLLIGASVVGGIYKNYAKKKEEERRRRQMDEAQPAYVDSAPQQEKDTAIPRSLEDFLKEQFEMEMDTEPQETVLMPQPEVQVDTPEPVEEKLETLNEGTAAFEETTKALFSDNFKDKDFSITDILSKQETNPIYDQDISDNNITMIGDEEFDGRKAIIYSEIMRKVV